MQVHHGFDVDRVGADTVNDGVGKAVEVELAIVAPDYAPAFRFGQDAPQRSSIFLKKVAAPASAGVPHTKARRLPTLGELQDAG